MAIIGQENTKKQIEIAILASKKRNMSIPHMLLSGFAGCGKTSMAKEMAQKLGTDFISIVPESLKDHKSIMQLLDSLSYSGYNEMGDRISEIKPAIVFLDECHNLPMYAQEKLGMVMENFTMETGHANKLFWVPYFTLIGATTLAGELSKPFKDRFKLNFFFDAYSQIESMDIVKIHAERLKVPITKKATKDIALRGRGIPRIIVRYLERCADIMYSLESDIITSKLTSHAFEVIGIDKHGFNKVELKILHTLYNSDKPLGLETLSVVTGESSKTIKNDLETYLIRDGMMIRSGSGRLITAKGRRYLEDENYVGKKNGRVTISPSYLRK